MIYPGNNKHPGDYISPLAFMLCLNNICVLKIFPASVCIFEA